MTYLPPLEELDRDGAIQETADKVDPETRAAFLRKAGVGAAAVIGGSAFAGALPAIGRAQSKAIPQSDIDILNFALTLEFLEAEFYAQAFLRRGLKGEAQTFARVVRNHEFSHVKFLQKVLGAKAISKPRFNFRDTVTNQAKFIATADVLENTGVHAYLGQVPNIKTKAVLVGAGRILPVEARHAAWIRDIRYGANQVGKSNAATPAPAAFEDGFSKQKILSIVQSTGFLVG